MNEPRNHLPRDLKALRYLDALNAGDLEAVSALWEDASHDPELEQVLVELDGAMFSEVLVNQGPLPEPRGRLRRRWVVAIGTIAAACVLAILAWPRHDTQDQGLDSPSSQSGRGVAHSSSDVVRHLAPPLEARRDLDEAAMPRFVWPLENALSASTPLDLLD